MLSSVSIAISDAYFDCSIKTCFDSVVTTTLERGEDRGVDFGKFIHDSLAASIYCRNERHSLSVPHLSDPRDVKINYRIREN